MTLTLPTSEPIATAWRLHDFRDEVITSPAATVAGTVTATSDPVDPDELWLVDHVIGTSTSPSATFLRLFDSERVSNLDLLDGTPSGFFGVGTWSQGLQIQPMRRLVAVWTGVQTGHKGTLRFQYRVMRRA